MNEEQILILVQAAQAGDRQAFGELAARFESTVFGIVMRRLRNRSEAREVAQDVFMQAWRKLSQLRDPRRFAAWLRRIAVRLAINRAVRKPVEALIGHETIGQFAGKPASPLDNLLAGERAETLRSGLARLRDLDRQTLLAFYFEGQSLKEMSDEFARPIGTIKRRLHTARSRLKEELSTLATV